MEKLCSIVRLLFMTNDGNAWATEMATEFGKPQHLYLISDDVVEEGDWFLMNGCIIRQSAEIYTNSVLDTIGGRHGIHVCKKIIATTDSELFKLHDNGSLGQGVTKLPTLSETFIKKYIGMGGVDTVMVKYESFSSHHVGPYRLKVTDNNEVVITHIAGADPIEKTITISNKELESLIDDAIDTHGCDNGVGETSMAYSSGFEVACDYIKEHLLKRNL